jgi:flagellar hook-associated protein 1 FlgK
MGLSVALSNALSGMRIGQNALDVLSRNVANSGTPGYHKQSLSVIDTLGVNSTYVRTGEVTRAFNQSLQQHYSRSASDSSGSPRCARASRPSADGVRQARRERLARHGIFRASSRR